MLFKDTLWAPFVKVQYQILMSYIWTNLGWVNSKEERDMMENVHHLITVHLISILNVREMIKR